VLATTDDLRGALVLKKQGVEQNAVVHALRRLGSTRNALYVPVAPMAAMSL